MMTLMMAQGMMIHSIHMAPYYTGGMPSIQVPFDPHEQPDYLAEGSFGDILFEPLAPEPEYEMTPEEERYLAFGEAVPDGMSYAGRGWTEPVVGRSEVCVFAGWPRRHVQVGAHCPHGMLKEDEVMGDDDGQE